MQSFSIADALLTYGSVISPNPYEFFINLKRITSSFISSLVACTIS